MITKKYDSEEWETLRILVDSPLEDGELISDDVLEATLKVFSMAKSEVEVVQAIRALTVSMAMRHFCDDIKSITTEGLLSLCADILDVAAGRIPMVEARIEVEKEISA